MNEKMDAIKIYKCKLNPVENDFGENRAGGYIILSRQWEVLEVETSLAYDSDIYTLDLDSIFGGMCFNFPAPFKRGDIVIAYGENDCWNTPFVFSYISTWSSKEMMNKGFLRHECPYRKGWEDFDKCRERLLKLGDSTDMHVLGTYADQGKFYRDNILIFPTDLEYYTGELQGYSRQLKPLSLYEKGEIDYELLVNSCFSIRTEEMAKEVRADCILPYYRSTMEELGVIPDREDKEN
ncbi:MAG: hypothetical protein LUE14_00185 [Clostridiales bacterium]|nr:hypothetical protein [Clostridiales bacterium]